MGIVNGKVHNPGSRPLSDHKARLWRPITRDCIDTNATLFWNGALIQIEVSARIASRTSRRLQSMRNQPFTLAYGVIVMLGMAGPAAA